MNTQPIEKALPATPTSPLLEVHSIFKTIQGEGPFVGMPAIFVRLTGCNLQCPLCDTEYTKNRVRLSPSELFSKITALDLSPQLVVFTGGEPLRQANLSDHVLHLLRSRAPLKVQIETNGTFPLPMHNKSLLSLARSDHRRLFVVCSPKTPKVNLQQECIDSWKYVVDYEDPLADDGLPLYGLGSIYKESVARPPERFPRNRIYLQPVDRGPDLDANDLNIKIVSELCMRHGYRLSLQTHKLLGLP